MAILYRFRAKLTTLARPWREEKGTLTVPSDPYGGCDWLEAPARPIRIA